MKIGKTFLTKLSVAFMVIGLCISFIGYAISGFDTENYIDNQNSWYRVVHFE
ncbi:hypothetical protein ACFP65_01930 [Marinilactibacillus sp. GCM10026970]|uniref:hypothetical protein n=1 Tax=Marinilactibacillus sp. GCM10026970 TaxID=3252642 RepID=UPI003623A746